MSLSVVADDDSLAANARIPLYHHQIQGVKKLLEYPAFALFDEPGAGKSKQVIQAAQILYEQRTIDTVIVIAPAAVRAVWYDPEFGELQKHLWSITPATITEFHKKKRLWSHGPLSERPLRWVISNYDFIRIPRHFKNLEPYCTLRTLIVFDESAALKNKSSLQSRACFKARQLCGRCVLLNGTPISHSPMDMLSQGNIMDMRINAPYNTLTQFRAHYAIMRPNPQHLPIIIGWRNLEELQQRFAPYVLRRLKVDCLDLPEKLPPVMRTVTLSDKTWTLYKQMRDDYVAWLDTQSVSIAAQAGVKAMRLAQITSGFLGGVRVETAHMIPSEEELPLWMDTVPVLSDEEKISIDPIKPVGDEKLQAFLDFCLEQWDIDPNAKILTWCYFRYELQRLAAAARTTFPNVLVGRITGGQPADERRAALRLLDPQTAPVGPALVVSSAGRRGLNLAAAHTVLYVSESYSLDDRLQSEDRTHRPGTTHPVSYINLIATGPQGQRTIDHVILRSRMKKEDIANWTTAAWRSAILEE